MMRRERLGDYSGRQVWLADVRHPSELNDPFIDTLKVLFILGDNVSRSDAQTALEAIAAREPIIVVLAAADVDEVWDQWADGMYLREDKKLTMVFSSDSREIADRLDDLFFGMSPGEDRFDEWSGYLIAGLGIDLAPYAVAARRQYAQDARSR